jgi:protein DGCR14
MTVQLIHCFKLLQYSWLFDKEQEHLERFDISHELPSIESQADYKKPLAIDSWSYKNMNYLMYTPDGAPYTPEEQVELAKKVPKVFYGNTRFVNAPFKEEGVPGKSTVGGSTGGSVLKKPTTKIGVDGKEIETDTPKVNGFSFVRTPSPTPGKS